MYLGGVVLLAMRNPTTRTRGRGPESRAEVYSATLLLTCSGRSLGPPGLDLVVRRLRELTENPFNILARYVRPEASPGPG